MAAHWSLSTELFRFIIATQEADIGPTQCFKMETFQIWCVILLSVIGWSAGESLPEILSLEADLHVEKRSSCSGKWKNVKQSTMCTSTDSPSAKDCGVSAADKTIILNTHNRLRAGVSPPSGDMLKMYWNDDLAALAQKWARHCASAHDTNENRQIPDTGKNMFIGQSWASGGLYDTWEKAIEEGWYGEVKYFHYGGYPSGVVGHYTQVVQGPANLIGCGKCMCSGSPLYICNYYRGNSMDNQHPYKSGAKCSNCKRCVDGLCDCGDLMCKNNGTMNAHTCECDCPGKWKGKNCMEYSCPPKDGDGCNNWFHANDCEKYFNVPDECPHMCGLCKGGAGAGTCKDDDNRCPGWASAGECNANPNYMLESCKKSCDQC